MKKLKIFHSLLVNFEDLGDGRKYADLVLTQFLIQLQKTSRF